LVTRPDFVFFRTVGTSVTAGAFGMISIGTVKDMEGNIQEPQSLSSSWGLSWWQCWPLALRW
jgi:hypothetical protein